MARPNFSLRVGLISLTVRLKIAQNNPKNHLCNKKSTMAKEKEKRLAEHFYIDKGLTAKEVALKVCVTEATISAWVTKGGWKARREAVMVSAATRFENLKDVIAGMAEERLQLMKEVDAAVAIGDTATATELRKQLARIDDGVAKWNKPLAAAQKESEVSLSVYIDVMERIFNALRHFDESLYLRTIPFQERHLSDISKG